MVHAGKKAKAFTLIEVLVALVIFSLVILGLLRYQLYSTEKNFQAYYDTVAAIQARSMLNRLHANYGMVYRQREYQQWNAVNQAVLPDAHGSYSCNALAHTCTVTLHWLAPSREVFALKGEGYGFQKNS